MPLQNRVTPLGEILATPARGTLMGNRGILHGPGRTLGVARWKHRHWVTCLLAFKGRHRMVMAPHRYTELFFLDEAVALAAGHRPCAECRRADYLRFGTCWQAALGGPLPRADTMDRALHAARVEPRTRRQVRWRAELSSLPDGTFVRMPDGGEALLVLGDALLPWSAEGYGAAVARHAGAEVEVLTPRPTVAVLAAGYRAGVHSSAEDAVAERSLNGPRHGAPDS